jgi:hypothetical protein
MAIEFEGTGSKVVNVGSGASLDDHAAGTVVMWVRPIAMLNDSRLWEKGGTNFRANLSSVTVELIVARATSNLTAVSSTGLIASAWQLVACTYDTAGAAADQRIYLGSLHSPVRESPAGYSSQTQGSGAVTSNAASSGLIGNRAGDSRDFGGEIARVVVDRRVWSRNELEQFRRNDRVPSGVVLDMHLGWESNTSAQIDRSGCGNHGTVAGSAGRRSHPPQLRPNLGYRNGRLLGMWSEEDAGGGGTAVPVFYNHLVTQGIA